MEGCDGRCRLQPNNPSPPQPQWQPPRKQQAASQHPPGLGHAGHVLVAPLGVKPHPQERQPQLLADGPHLVGARQGSKRERVCGGVQSRGGSTCGGTTGHARARPAQPSPKHKLNVAHPQAALTWYRWLLTSAHVLCSVSTVAPLSSNWPPGSSVTLCPSCSTHIQEAGKGWAGEVISTHVAAARRWQRRALPVLRRRSIQEAGKRDR